MPDREIDSFYHSYSNALNSKTTEEEFNEWIAPLRRIQISAVSFLTGILYLVYSQLDTFAAPVAMLPVMTAIHLYLIAPVLFIISLLSLSKNHAALTTVLLIIAPVAAAAGNLYIVMHLDNQATYLTELYLILFWTFTVSGLRLAQATVSAAATSAAILLVTCFLSPLAPELLIMHVFWMLSAFSFGFLGAYLLEKSNKSVFLNHQALERLAVIDKLTDLYNRTKLDELLQSELDRSKRFNHPFGMVILDIDHFKRINDSFGHQVGDEVLVAIAHLLTEHLRSNDKAVRWGGEEFILIYLETSADELLGLAEELRQKIEKHLFNTVGSVTASFGVTLYHDGDTVTSIIKRADKALYIAKRSGRNRVEFL